MVELEGRLHQAEHFQVARVDHLDFLAERVVEGALGRPPLLHAGQDAFELVHEGLEEHVLLVFPPLVELLGELRADRVAARAHHSVPLLRLLDRLVQQQAEDQVQDLGGGLALLFVVLREPRLRF